MSALLRLPDAPKSIDPALQNYLQELVRVATNNFNSVNTSITAATSPFNNISTGNSITYVTFSSPTPVTASATWSVLSVGGWLIQWGQIEDTAIGDPTGLTIHFPVQFLSDSTPTVLINVLGDTSGIPVPFVESTESSGFTLSNTATYFAYAWIAIGPSIGGVLPNWDITP